MSGSDILAMTGLGALGIALFSVCYTFGLKLSTAYNGSLLINSQPIFTTLLAPLIIKEDFSHVRVLGALAGVAGGLGPGDILTHEYFWGNLILLGGALSISRYTILLKRYVVRYGGFVPTFLTMLLRDCCRLGVPDPAGAGRSCRGKAELTNGLFLNEKNTSFPLQGGLTVSYAEHFQEMEKGIGLAHAIAEADRCLLCYDAPCSKACPAETDPAGFIRKLRLRNITGAIRTIKENNILGGACGVLCPAARLCEKECSATGISRPIEIGGIQRFLVEYGWQIGFKVFEKAKERRGKVAVVGSGPAGLSCAGELAKQGYQVTVFAERPEPGGIIRYGVPAYRFDKEFFKNELQDLYDLGVEFRCNKKIQGKEEAEKLLAGGYEAVFLSPGLWGSQRLIPGAGNIQGVFTSADFLAALREERFEELGKQIEGKTVAVIGGGSVAMDCVESAGKLGAKDVYLVYRRSFAQMPAEEEERLDALRLGVHFLVLNQPVDYLSDSSGRVKALKLVRTRLAESDASGRRKPVEIEGSEWELGVEFVVEAIGQKPDETVDWSPAVKLDKRGLVVADPETGRTSSKLVFAGGDIVRGPALVVEAVQDGKLAARAIAEALSKSQQEESK